MGSAPFRLSNSFALGRTPVSDGGPPPSREYIKLLSQAAQDIQQLQTQVVHMSVLDFGMKGLGSDDDTAAWKALLAQVPSTGAVIDIPGSFDTLVQPGAIVLPKTQLVVLKGAGKSSRILGTGGAIVQIGYYNQTVRNLTIQESNPNGDTSTIGLLVSGVSGGGGFNISGATVSGVTVSGRATDPGIANRKGTGIKVLGVAICHILGAGDLGAATFWNHGIETGPLNGSMTTALRVNHIALSSNVIGMYSTQTSEAAMADCTLEDNNVGLHVEDAVVFGVRGSHFENSTGVTPLDIELVTGGLTTANCVIEGGGLNLHNGSTYYFSDTDYTPTILNNCVSGQVLVRNNQKFGGPTYSGAGYTLTRDYTGLHSVGAFPTDFLFDAQYNSIKISIPVTFLSTVTGVPPTTLITDATAPILTLKETTGNTVAIVGKVHGTWNGVTGNPGIFQSDGPVVLAAPLNTPKLIIDTSGNVILKALPTAAAGLPSGALWNNLGVLNIAP